MHKLPMISLGESPGAELSRYAHIRLLGDLAMSSWFNPKTGKRVSPIQGRGLFAREAISSGEIVAVKGGTIMDTAAFAQVREAVSPAEIQIEDSLYIVPASVEEVEVNILCLNHSCHPNVGVRGRLRSSPWGIFQWLPS